MPRIAALVALAEETGTTVDAVYAITQDLDIQALRSAIGRVSALPRYRKSRLNPYVSTISKAPFRDSLDDPTSQFE